MVKIKGVFSRVDFRGEKNDEGKLFGGCLVGVGMTMGRGGSGLKDRVFAPAPHDFVLPHPRLDPNGADFTHSRVWVLIIKKNK